MQVDKRNGNVNYNDEFHQYWNDEGQKFISVTTLIGRFEQPFDQDFWSKYKALERLIGSQKFAAMEKMLSALNSQGSWLAQQFGG